MTQKIKQPKIKKQISEMTYGELTFVNHVINGLREQALLNKNLVMADEFRTKLVKIQVEILKRFDEEFDI